MSREGNVERPHEGHERQGLGNAAQKGEDRGSKGLEVDVPRAVVLGRWRAGAGGGSVVLVRIRFWWRWSTSPSRRWMWAGRKLARAWARGIEEGKRSVR